VSVMEVFAAHVYMCVHVCISIYTVCVCVCVRPCVCVCICASSVRVQALMQVPNKSTIAETCKVCQQTPAQSALSVCVHHANMCVCMYTYGSLSPVYYVVYVHMDAVNACETHCSRVYVVYVHMDAVNSCEHFKRPS
jgi:hypothetical protein